MSVSKEGGLLETAMFADHVEAGGKIVPFAGWRMPVQYRSILEEHKAVRERAGLFDVSHMGEIELRGRDRVKEADRLTTARTSGKEPGFVQYALLLTPDAGIIDDILVYVLEDTILLVVNAANKDKDLRWIQTNAEGNVDVVDRSAATSQIALQGPRAREILERLGCAASARLDYYRSIRGEIVGVSGILSRTGYTGELGYEFYCNWDDGPKIWRALLDAGETHGIEPVGLGARDSLRMEMGYCLWGNEIDETTNPLEAGLRWTVKAKKSDWIGKERYKVVKAAGEQRNLVGFRLGPRDIPRPGYPILHGGKEVGAMTSGGFSPTLGVGIGLGYVAAPVASEEDGFRVRIRRRDVTATLVRGSFVPSSAMAAGEEE